MKYGPIPANIIERIALWSGNVPVPVLDSLVSIMKARALMAAVRLGIFEALKHGPRNAADIAREKDLDPKSLELLLRGLVWAGYATWSSGVFALTPLSKSSMVEGGSQELFGFVQWNYKQWEMVENLEETIRTGKGADFHEHMTSAEDWLWYQKAMQEIARIDSKTVARRVPVPRGARRLVDVAGSHGLLGAAICRRHPPMRSTVIDLPIALDHARHLAQASGITDIVDHQAGDIRSDELGTGFDVALLANILHHFMPDLNRDILARVHRALNVTGTVAIWDIETPNSDSPPDMGDGAALYFRVTSSALCYSGSDYGLWLREAGFENVRIIRPALSPGNVLVVARRV